MFGESKIKRLQSATEYLLTYGWAFLIVAIVVVSLYLFVFAPSTLTPSSCSFSSGAYCQDLILGSANSLSKMAMLLTNSNPYPIINPSITVNVTGIPPIQGTCVPNYALPGGAVICSATISPALSQGALSSGRFVFSYTPCPGGNVIPCAGNARQSYTGSYNTHVSPLLSPTDISIMLIAQNSSQVAVSTSFDKLTANVRLLGTPLSGATVNFTSNSINAPISPLVITSDSSGNVVAYISSSVSGNVLVSASFANVVANTVVGFTPPVCYTLSLSGASGASANAILVDGIGYSSFPQQICYGKGTSHSYSFQTTVAGALGIQYLFSSASGCGSTAQSGTLFGAVNCTLSGNYLTQYFLTTSASPGIGGTVTPSSGWYNAGASATLGETPSAGYAFNGFVGSGAGSYTGASTSPSITLNNPITETGSFTSTTTSSSTTSSTSTTSTSTTVPPNPSCGTFSGDITYSSSISLTCNVIATNSITVNNGVTLDQNGFYVQADNTFTNFGTVTDRYDGGVGGSGGSYVSPPINATASTDAKSKTSAFSATTIRGGAAGTAGGGGGSGYWNCQGTCGITNIPGAGGNAGNGGGIIEIYATNVINNGVFDVSGSSGASGANAIFVMWNGDTCHVAVGSGGGGAGSGGSGGIIFIGYNSNYVAGTVATTAGSSGSIGYGAAGVPSNCPGFTGGGNGGNGGSYGGGGGGGGYNGGNGGAGACGGTELQNGCSGGSVPTGGSVVTVNWAHP